MKLQKTEKEVQAFLEEMGSLIDVAEGQFDLVQEQRVPHIQSSVAPTSAAGPMNHQTINASGMG